MAQLERISSPERQIRRENHSKGPESFRTTVWQECMPNTTNQQERWKWHTFAHTNHSLGLEECKYLPLPQSIRKEIQEKFAQGVTLERIMNGINMIWMYVSIECWYHYQGFFGGAFSNVLHATLCPNCKSLPPPGKSYWFFLLSGNGFAFLKLCKLWLPPTPLRKSWNKALKLHNITYLIETHLNLHHRY